MKQSVIIDIGSSKVLAMVVSPAADGAIIVHSVKEQPYPGYRLGELPNAAALGEAFQSISDALRGSHGIKLRNACIGVPAPFTKIMLNSCKQPVESKSHRVTEFDIDALLEQSVDFPAPDGFELIHSSLFNFELDGMAAEHSPVGKAAKVLSADAAHTFVDAKFSDIVSDALSIAGITADPFVSSQLADALFTIPADDRENGALLIDCGGEHCDISLVYDNALLCSESIAIGGEHFTRDLAYGLRLPFRTADEVKRRYVFGLDYGNAVERVTIPGEGLALLSCGAIQSIIEARAVRLAGSMLDVINSIERSAQAHFPLYLVGGGIALMRGGTERLSKLLGRRVYVSMPNTSRMNTVNYAPAFALAHFMLYGSGSLAVGGRRLVDDIVGNIVNFFTYR